VFDFCSIIDLDVHQGNGNAVLFQNNPSVFTFSMHCKSNYFSAIENSDLDIELEQGICDEIYMRNLNGALPSLLDAVRPKLVFYQGKLDYFPLHYLIFFLLSLRVFLFSDLLPL